jgi:hypothetical protein
MPDVKFQICSTGEEDDSCGETPQTTPGKYPTVHEADSPPLSPSTAERKPLRVEFIGMEELERNSVKKDSDASSNKDFIKFKRRIGNDARFREPRLSLLGKPLCYKAHRKDIKFRRAQAKIYNFLERPKDWKSITYHLFV